ncbi:MAG: HPr family phosphocarrier protein [Candidatus Zixiibacteriota bacterium]|nr:MAG: HPr family phosphocarrier protein [candidate division Zixibacteria bacterium]
MVSKSATIVNKLGLHARPCAQLVSVATKFESEIFFVKNGLRVNGKSIMGVMVLAAEKGTVITIEVQGPDEDEAVEALLEVIDSGFGEEI